MSMYQVYDAKNQISINNSLRGKETYQNENDIKLGKIVKNKQWRKIFLFC
jgi:hypothetical protein